MPQHVREKYGKLWNFSNLSSKGALFQQKLTEIDDTWILSNVHKKEVTYKISAQYVKACMRKSAENLTDRYKDERMETRTDITIP